MTDFDVLIAGAGPAGCATALSLASFAPELRVGLIDPVAARSMRIGETVPPQINPILSHLGLWDAFSRGGHCPSYRTLVAWGGAQLGGNEFLLHAHQLGWRLDRAAFDEMLLTASAGVAAILKAKVTSLARQAGVWRVSLSDGAIRSAEFVVDATGRAAVLARQCRLRPITIDRLIGCSLHTRSLSDGTEGLMIESFAEGWWYTAALPSGDRVAVCMTDADRVRPLELSSMGGFARLLAQTRHVRRVVDLDDVPGRPVVWPASTRLFDSTGPLPLLCVGDAGLCFDPASGDGIVKALRSGVFASYAIADWLRGGDASGLARHRVMLRRQFSTDRETLREYYELERRWPDRPFWRRRHGEHSLDIRAELASNIAAAG